MRQKVHNNIPHSAEVFPLSSAESGQSPPSGRFLFIHFTLFFMDCLFGRGCLGAKSQHIVQALLSSQRKNYFVLNHFVEKIRTHPRFKASHKRHNQRNLLQGTKVLPDPAYSKQLHRLLWLSHKKQLNHR